MMVRIDGNALKCILECGRYLGVRVEDLEGVQISQELQAVRKCGKHSIRGTSGEADMACSGSTVLSQVGPCTWAVRAYRTYAATCLFLTRHSLFASQPFEPCLYHTKLFETCSYHT